MAREWVHVMHRWGKFQVPHYDTTFVITNPDIPGVGGLDIAWFKLFFSFKHHDKIYPLVLVHWFSKIDEEPDVNTGMWWVEPDFDAEGEALFAVIHLEAHLTGKPNAPLSASITYISAPDMFLIYFM